MDSRDLEYVAAVAKTKSFSQSAQLLFISQPALSQYIKRLEKSLNVALFYRTRTHVELTPAGQYYIQQGQEILKQMQGLEQAMRTGATMKRSSSASAYPSSTGSGS